MDRLEQEAAHHLRNAQRPGSAPTSAITGPAAFPLPKDAGRWGLRARPTMTGLGGAADDTAIVFAICDEFEACGYRGVGAALRQQGPVVNHTKFRG